MRLPFPLKVSRRDNLDRYYLLKAFGIGVFLHRIHHDENEGIFHNHPWNGFSFIFGSYLEERKGEQKKMRRFFNVIRAARFHRVEVAKPVWTLFVHGPRCNRWQVCDHVKVLSTEPWRNIGGKTSYV